MKKIAYAVSGVTLIILATIIGRLDGGGADLVLIVGLGLGLLVASADVQARRRSA